MAWRMGVLLLRCNTNCRAAIRFDPSVIPNGDGQHRAMFAPISLGGVQLWAPRVAIVHRSHGSYCRGYGMPAPSRP